MRARTQQARACRLRRAPAGRHRAPRPARGRRASQLGSLLVAGLLMASMVTAVTAGVTPGIAAADSAAPTPCTSSAAYVSTYVSADGREGFSSRSTWQCTGSGSTAGYWEIYMQGSIGSTACRTDPTVTANIYAGYSPDGSVTGGSLSGYWPGNSELILVGSIATYEGTHTLSMILDMSQSYDLCSGNSFGYAWGTVTLDAAGLVPPVPTAPPVPDPVAVAQQGLDAARGLAVGSGRESSLCKTQPGQQQVTDSTVEGVHTSVYFSTPTATEVDVCFRAETSPGTGYGGLVAIKPTVPGVSGTPGVPTTDVAGSACSTAAPNAVPGTHPMASGSTAGVPYAFDTYSNGSSAAWVCVQVGSTVNTRVLVPVSAPSVTGVPPSYLVTFYPDAGTL